MASRANQPGTTRGGWVRMTPAEVIAFSAEGKQAIKEAVDKTIDRYMKPVVLERRGVKAAFGDVYDLYTKWRGQDLILMAKRRGGQVADHDEEDFETKTGRLTLVGVDLFDISYFRHTDRWFTILRDCSLKVALSFFRKPGPLWPW